jgi:hypothetical protein
LSGEHTFVLSQGGKESLSFSFRAEPGGMVTINGPVKARDVNAVVIANLASSARVYASDGSLKGGLKDTTPQPIPEEGLELGGITASSELTLDDGKSQRTLPMEVGNAPTLTISLAGDPNLGMLEVEVRPAGAERSLDGGKSRALRVGKNRVSSEPGPHVLHITKEGYEPVERTVELKKGQTLALGVIELKPVMLKASLAIEGATPSAEVLIDGTPLGSTGANGALGLNDLSPGEHTITLRKAEFEDKQFSRSFTAGQTVRINGAEGQLISSYGSLEFRVTPAGASITYKRADELQAHNAENGKSVRVKAGQYAITAAAAGYRQRQGGATVELGKSSAVEWTLAAEESKKAPPPPPPAPYFEDPDAWTKDDAWWTHKGGATGWVRRNQGVHVIDFQRQVTKIGPIKRTRHVEWVVDQKDAANRIEYSFDFGTLERHVIVDGKSEPSNKVKLSSGAATGDSYTIQIDISAERIVIKDAQGKVLDQYQRPDRSRPLGKFGFRGDLALAVKKTE